MMGSNMDIDKGSQNDGIAFVFLAGLTYLQAIISGQIGRVAVSKEFLPLVVLILVFLACIFFSIRICCDIFKKIKHVPKEKVRPLRIGFLVSGYLALLLIPTLVTQSYHSGKNILGLQEILDDSYFPILEEFAYRGALILFLGRKIKRNWQIATLAALVFAIAHLDFSFSHMLNYFLWGYVLSYAYLYTKSLIPGMFMHITGNICIDLLWLF